MQHLVTYCKTGLLLAMLFATVLTQTQAQASTHTDVQKRIDADLANGDPIVVHVVVALCDNANQWIVPVPKALGNGQDPKNNLYWGALYGVKTHLPRKAGWHRVALVGPPNNQILERIVLRADIERNGKSVPVYLVADAWDGAHMKSAVKTYLKMVAGRATERMFVPVDDTQFEMNFGGNSHLLAFIGHNGLMDFSLPSPYPFPNPMAKATTPRSAMVLACQSKAYFRDRLKAAGAHPLVLTTGNMAPEAYTLDAVVRAWVENKDSVTEGAAKAYDQYQKCGLKAAHRLFWGEE